MIAEIDLGVITTVITGVGAIASVFGFGWKLSKQFMAAETLQRDRIDALATASREQLKEHEELDQTRHEENLERFQTINVAIGHMTGEIHHVTKQ